MRWLLPLIAALAAPSCGKSSDRTRDLTTEPVTDGEPALIPLDAGDDFADEEEDLEQPPLGPDPLVLEDGVGGLLELAGDGLPAIRADGKLIARAENRYVGTGEDRRLALRLYDVGRGAEHREIVVYAPRGGSKPKPPDQRKLDAALARANQALADGKWRSMIEPMDVANDGWIKCRKGVQSFSLAGMTVSYGEPRLVVRRGDEVVYETIREGWVAKPSDPACETRGYIADAAIDLITGALWLELAYCGECGVEPRQAIVRLPAGDPPAPGP